MTEAAEQTTFAPSAPVKAKRVRRTREQMEAARGAELAATVARLPLDQLASFAQAMSTKYPKSAAFVKGELSDGAVR